MKNRGEELIIASKDGRVVGKARLDVELEILFEEGHQFIISADAFVQGNQKMIFSLTIVPVEAKPV